MAAQDIQDWTQSMTIEGNVQVIVQSGSLTVQPSSGQPLQVEFPVTQQVNVEQGNVDSNITNQVISGTETVCSPTTIQVITLLAGGQTYNILDANLLNPGLFDSVSAVITSSIGDLNNYNITWVEQRLTTPRGWSWTSVYGTVAPYAGAYFENVDAAFVSEPLALDPTFPTTTVVIQFEAIAAVAHDTVTVQFIYHYASTEVTNQPGNNVPTIVEPEPITVSDFGGSSWVATAPGAYYGANSISGNIVGYSAAIVNTGSTLAVLGIGVSQYSSGGSFLWQRTVAVPAGGVVNTSDWFGVSPIKNPGTLYMLFVLKTTAAVTVYLSPETD